MTLEQDALRDRMLTIAKYLREHPRADRDAFALPSGKFRRTVVALTYEGDEAWVGMAVNVTRRLDRREDRGRVSVAIIADERS